MFHNKYLEIYYMFSNTKILSGKSVRNKHGLLAALIKSCDQESNLYKKYQIIAQPQTKQNSAHTETGWNHC